MINNQLCFNSSLIRDHYSIAYQSSQIQNIENAQIFVLGEVHDPQINCPAADLSTRCGKLNAALIYEYAEPDSILFLEGDESMEDLESDLSLESRLERSIQLWEPEDARKIKDISKETLCSVLKEKYQNKLNSQYYINRLIYTQIVKIYGWDLPVDYEINTESLRVLKEDGFDFKGSKNWTLIYGMLEQERVNLSKEILQAYEDGNASLESLKIKESRLSAIFSAQSMIRRELFPVRTKNMVNTIKLIKADPPFRGKAFFLCGAEHVKSTYENQNDQAYSVDLLYKELEKCKGVALVPKILKSLYENKDEVTKEEAMFLFKS